MNIVYSMRMLKNGHTPPSRLPLREYMFSAISDAIVRGEFAPGERLRDTQLAKQLGASRTPTREALVRLVDSGFLVAEPGYGFRVAPLSRREVEEIYDLLILLEQHAFGRCVECTGDQAAEMHAIIAEARGKGGDPLEIMRLDAAWHRTLLRGYPNAKLHQTLENLRQLALRYDAAYFMNAEFTGQSFDEHESVTRAFASGDLVRARDLLAHHWERSYRDLLDGLPEDTETEDEGGGSDD